MSSPFHPWMVSGWSKVFTEYSSNSRGKREAELTACVSRESTLLRNLAESTFSEGGFNESERADCGPCLSCTTLWHPWSWRCRWSNSSSMQASDRSNSTQVSLNKVLHAYDLCPLILNLGGWKLCNLKQDTFYWWEEKRVWWGLYTQPQTPARCSS